MAYAPIALTIPQYDKLTLANWWLKAYDQGTVTPLSMATDAAAGTLLVKAELDTEGFPITAGSARFIPFINGDYDLWCFPTAAEADANDTSNAIQFADNLNADPQNASASATGYTVANKAAAVLLTPVSGKSLVVEGSDGGYFVAAVGASPATYSDSSSLYCGTVFIPTGGDGSTAWVRPQTDGVNVKWFGAKADGTTDDSAAIEEATVIARVSRGKVFFPANADGQAVYDHATTLTIGASDVVFEGETTGVNLNYTGTGTGVIIDTTTQRERWGIVNISLISSTGAIALDFTYGNYGVSRDFEIAYTTASAKLIYAIGQSGNGPYFNAFDGFTLFGDAGRTQTGIFLGPDSSGNLADGPNANIFSNIKRAASLNRGLDLIAGTGNLFSNFGGESIKDALMVLNDVASFADSGTSTSTTTGTLVDTSKTWSVVAGDALNFTNDTVTLTSGLPGESRRIVSNTVDTLTLDKPWSQNPGATVTYTISEGKAVKNMFVNVRQEGLASDNPDGIRIEPGARGNEISQIEIGSLGTGVVIDDQGQDQTNKVRQGDLVVSQYIIENPGASTTIELIIRSGADGGIRSGSNMSLEYAEMLSPNFVTGTAIATLTVDHGGASTGAGTETQVCVIDDFNSKQCYVSGDKVMRSTTNNGIYASLTTNANVNAASDFIVNIAYRVS